jgi:hypothetical protein
LIILSLFRKRHKQLLYNGKGFSSIVGAIFALVAIIAISTTVFLWTLSQDTIYNEEVKTLNQLELERLSEQVKGFNANCTICSDGEVTVTATLQNSGPLIVELTTLWVQTANATWNSYNFTKLSGVYLKAGTNTTLYAHVKIAGVRSGLTYQFAVWLITGRGNVVPLEEYTGKILIASVAQGIGALSIDFENFKYYNVTKQGSYYILVNYPNGASGYMVNQGGDGIAFEVTLTNLDEKERIIVLSPASVLFSMFPTTEQQIRAAFWYIVNVNDAGIISNAYSPIALPYGVKTKLYFASSRMISGGATFLPSKASFTKTAPVNLALIGTIGGSPYGQNIPFVSIYINN